MRRTSRCVASTSRGVDAGRLRRRRGARPNVPASSASTQRALAAALAPPRSRPPARRAPLAAPRDRSRCRAARATSIMLSATHHRQAEALQLEHQAQVQAQVGGVDDADQQVRRRLAGAPAEHHVARDRLVGRRRVRGCRRRAGRARAIACGRAAGREAAFLALDRDAGVVGDLLAAAGQPVEQRGLAAVGFADQREAQRPPAMPRPRRRSWGRCGAGDFHPDDSTSRRRRANVRLTHAHHERSRPGHGLREDLDVLTVTKPNSSSRRSSGGSADSSAHAHDRPLVPGGGPLRVMKPGSSTRPAGVAVSPWDKYG